MEDILSAQQDGSPLLGRGADRSTVIDTIFDDPAFKPVAERALAGADPAPASWGEVIEHLRAHVMAEFESKGGALPYDPMAQIQALGLFAQRIAFNVNAYRRDLKPRPEAVYWPDDTRRNPTPLADTLPFVLRHPLLDRTTPIGSAGSCFAQEISYAFQDRGFNYVITEPDARIEDGVGVCYFDPEETRTSFSANWGILFNVPSFRQLAEKAFGERELPRLLLRVETEAAQAGHAWTDPYREGVFFANPEAFDRDYAYHIAAARAALEQCKVFIITLGLNECWEYVPDGSVLSRLPRDPGLLPLIRLRIPTAAENVADLQRFLDIIRAHNPDFTLIVSVSPVPLLATAMAHQRHVVESNALSKAALRLAAEEFVAANDNVFYFPSYELVTTCLADPWEPDKRHVSRAAVARVMEMFDAMYLVDG